MHILDRQFPHDDLRKAVRGGDHAVLTRVQTIRALARARAPEDHATFAAVLRDKGAAAGERAAAAAALAHLATEDAVAALVAATRDREPAVLAAVVTGLGWVGDASVLPALEKVSAREEGALGEVAMFARAFIAHRHDVAGHDLPLPPDDAYVEIPAGAAPVIFEAAPEEEAKECLDSLREQRLGFTVAEHPVHRITCHLGGWMLLVNRQALGTGAVDAVQERRTLFGVLARKRPDDEGYSAEFFVLTTPVGEGVYVFVTKLSGGIYWGGSGTVVGDALRVRIRALARSGALPASLHLTLDDEGPRLLDGVFDHSIHEGRAPRLSRRETVA